MSEQVICSTIYWLVLSYTDLLTDLWKYTSLLCHTVIWSVTHWSALSHTDLLCHALTCSFIHWPSLSYINLLYHILICSAIHWNALSYTDLLCHRLICSFTHQPSLSFRFVLSQIHFCELCDLRVRYAFRFLMFISSCAISDVHSVLLVLYCGVGSITCFLLFALFL